jgi:hypothetical protein
LTVKIRSSLLSILVAVLAGAVQAETIPGEILWKYDTGG